MKIFRMFFRSIRDALKSVKRNFSLSLASISCISITLIIVAASIIVSMNVNNFTRLIEKDVTVVVFMNKDVDKKGLETFESELSKIENIASVKFKSKEESKNEMMKESDLFASTMSEWSDDENPLKDSYLIKVDNIEKIKNTAASIKDLENVEVVNYGEGMVEKLVSAFSLIKKISILLVAVLIVVTVFLIINTIKLTIFSRKREISIMRLVGASNFSIKNPFVIEGMLLGALGSILPIILVIYGYLAFYNHFEGQLFSSLIKLINPTPFIYQISLLVLILGIIVGMFGSSRAVRKYLKV
ncbi:MAG: permease-like cell division protein FtsX [bacterium]|nr:permease-like cell division protein FtsX [bacterium]